MNAQTKDNKNPGRRRALAWTIARLGRRLRQAPLWLHALPLLLYMPIYLIWFAILEQRQVPYRLIYMEWDAAIPFWEVFVIPYFLWFFYVSAVVLYLLFTDKAAYYKAIGFLFSGMTLFLIISTFWPNGHHLRPPVMPRDNIFSQMVAFLYRKDTATNLWPSIHVYNSLGAHIGLCSCLAIQPDSPSRRLLRLASLGLCLSIICSTVFLKQHSLFDVLTAFGTAAVFYLLVYGRTRVYALRPAPGGR